MTYESVSRLQMRILYAKCSDHDKSIQRKLTSNYVFCYILKLAGVYYKIDARNSLPFSALCGLASPLAIWNCQILSPTLLLITNYVRPLQDENEINAYRLSVQMCQLWNHHKDFD